MIQSRSALGFNDGPGLQEFVAPCAICTEDRTKLPPTNTNNSRAIPCRKTRVTTSSTLLRQGASSLLEYLR